jgi:Predicted membrane protein (DUF2207)
VPAFHNFITGYEPAILALAFVLAYFLLMAQMVRFFEPEQVLVPAYNPPKGATPAVAAWLFERGKLARALAAAVVNMAAKGYLRIEQNGDLYSLTQLGTDVSLLLAPEEDALARTLFKGYDCFDFDNPTPRLKEAIKAFHWALLDTTYFSERIALSFPAWIVSGLGILFALLGGHLFPHSNLYVTALLILAFTCFMVAVRTLPGVLAKIISRLPGTNARARPWSDADRRAFTFLVAALGGIALLAVLSTTATALLVTAFLAVDAVFYHALQGPTADGRKIMAQLAGYRKFLAEVDADVISRKSCETTPTDLNQKDAYAIAFHLDLGWGEQFVSTAADLVEPSQVFGKVLPDRAAW